MSILEKLDKNYADQTVGGDNFDEYVIPCEPFTIYGATFYENEGFHKMPLDYVKTLNYGRYWGSRVTTGVRITFSTDANKIKIKARYFDLVKSSKSSILGNHGFFICEVMPDGEERYARSFMPPYYTKDGKNYDESDTHIFEGILRGGMRNYVMYLPTYSGISELTIMFNEGAKVEKYEPYNKLKPILFYGNSITEGASATRPDTNFACIICKKSKTDIINYSISGGAKGQPEDVEFLKGVDCSVFVCDYDANAPDANHLRETHLPLYKALFSAVQYRGGILVQQRIQLCTDALALYEHHRWLGRIYLHTLRNRLQGVHRRHRRSLRESALVGTDTGPDGWYLRADARTYCRAA